MKRKKNNKILYDFGLVFMCVVCGFSNRRNKNFNNNNKKWNKKEQTQKPS